MGRNVCKQTKKMSFHSRWIISAREDLFIPSEMTHLQYQVKWKNIIGLSQTAFALMNVFL